MKKLTMTLACVLAFSSASLFAKDWEMVRIAVDVPYEPFEYKAPDGSLTGFEIDLGNAVCADIGVKCEWTIQAWDGIIPGLLARKYDAIMSSMSITEERAKKVLFSEGYYNTPSGWFGKKGAGIDVSDKASLKGKKVGVQRGTLQDNYVSDNLGDVVEIKRYTTADDQVLDLKGGRLDLVFVDFPVGEQTILKDENYEAVGDLVKLGDGVGVAFRKRDKDLAEKFNASLKKLKENGTYKKIMDKYFKYDIMI
ncbi:MAG: nickel transporter [Oleiphilus sp.]|nr:MAG: nickel transporter [Oleiphilus sp.]